MATDEHTRRFRTHVVQELYQTEQEYTAALEFTVNHIMAKMRLKAQNDHSLTEETVSLVFSNMADLLVVHKNLLQQLEETLGGRPCYESTIAGCYLGHRDQFDAYKVYGENNEHAQKVLYELEDNPLLKAFFLGVMLLGGKSDVSISSYVFKPIQRICKYPLLFKELLKYTPESHEDYCNTEQALSMMRGICSVINEAKRRVEKLEVIADWQGTVDGWEGSPVVDTCNELVKEGTLIKISAGNMQERVFFLFDNLLVYCKRAAGFPLRSKAEQKTLLFRGRIPVESMAMENIDDGTADYHTSGVIVCNSWKVRNIAKNKWFVLVARTPAEKQQWIEAFRIQKDRIKRVAAGIARDTRSLMLDKGSKLHCRLKQEGHLLQDHRYRIRVYPKSFLGSEFVKWLIEIGEAGDASEAVRLGQCLLESGVIHHVSDKHQFKDGSLVYRFRYDDGTFHSKWETSDSLARGMRVYTRLHSLFEPLIKDQRTGLRQVKSAISGQRLIDWLLNEHDITSREEGVILGSHFMATGLLKHVTDDHKFKDSGGLYYRFIPDLLIEDVRRTTGSDTPTARADFCCVGNSSLQTLLVPHSAQVGGYGFTVVLDNDVVMVGMVEAGSPAELAGMHAGQRLLGVTSMLLGSREQGDSQQPLDQCLEIIKQAEQRKAPIAVTVVREEAEVCVLRPRGRQFGFQIKGTCPVVIQRVEQGSVAAQAGLTPGCCILKVEGENVVRATHDKVVEAIKSTLTQQDDEEQASLSLKIGVNMVCRSYCYTYESTDDSVTHIQASCHNSRYTYTLPAELFKLYADEAAGSCKLVKDKQVTEQRVQDYVTEMEALMTSYTKVHTALCNPRYPSYRPCGVPPSALIEACPINLHTFSLEAATANSTSGYSTAGNAFPNEGRISTHHFTTCVAVPTIINKNFAASDKEVLSYCYKVRKLLATINRLELELQRDAGLLHKLTSRTAQQDTDTSLLHVSNNSTSSVHSSTDGSSPLLNQRATAGMYVRARAVSVADPNPVIKLVLDGIARTLQSIQKLCKDELFVSVLENTAPCVRNCSVQDTLQQWRSAVTKCSDDLAMLPDPSPQVVDKFGHTLLETLQPVIAGIRQHLHIAISLHDNVDTAYSMDRLFAQCLVAVVTALAHQLSAAVSGHLNPMPDYHESPADVSRQWLELIAEKGVCVCITGLLQLTSTPELAQLKDLSLVVEQLKTVSFFIKELSECTPSNSTLPRVTLAGDHSSLQVTFHLPSTVMDQVPDTLSSGAPIMIHPMLFNKGLAEMNEVSDAYQYEQDLNDAAFIHLRDYYRALRHYHLNRATLPEDATERSLVLEQISQPLVAMDVLVRQMEAAIREPNERSVGLLSILAELTQRMGCIRVLTCDSGVYRCQAALSLEEVLLLIRCHGLPPRCLKSALSALRRDFLPLLEKKNTVDISKSFADAPPWLYELNKS